MSTLANSPYTAYTNSWIDHFVNKPIAKMYPPIIHTDQEAMLIRQLKAGDEKAFEHFYNLYSAPIYRKLLKLVKVDLVAEEILQGLFIKLWEKKRLLDPERPIKLYLNQMAQNMVIDFYRNLAREQSLQVSLKNKLSEMSQSTEEKIIFKETSDLLEKAVSMLPNQQQTVFRLCKLEGRSYDEVSKILGISSSTINGHIVKATKKVKAYLINIDSSVAFVLISVFAALIGSVLKNIS
ncbi:MAG: RNA polymerase sigma factor [Mucilaginibacter sp.]